MPTVVHRVNWGTVTSHLLAVDVPPIVLCALISPRLQLTLLPTQPSQSSYCTSFSVGFWENECWRVYGGKCGVPDKGDCKYLIIMMMVVKARINFLDMVFTEVANYLTLIKYIQPMSMSPFSGEKKYLFNGRAQFDLPGSSKCLLGCKNAQCHSHYFSSNFFYIIFTCTYFKTPVLTLHIASSFSRSTTIPSLLMGIWHLFICVFINYNS